MPWTLTGNVDEFLAAAGDFLRSRPAQNTILLGVTESVRVRGPAAFGDAAVLFGWWHDPDGAPAAAFLHTPPQAVVLTAMPHEAASSLAGELAVRGRSLAGVNGDTHAGPAFAAAWRARTGQPSYTGMRSRLYRLGELRLPAPAPPGSARVAAQADRDLLVAWLDAFHREALPGEPADAARIVGDRLSHGGLWIWEAEGQPVSMAGLTRAVAGQVRVGLVYTPPHLRRRGFGAAVTAAVSKTALEGGVGEVLLFTDLANPTSNAIYQRLGYRPVSDRVVLGFRPPGAARGAGHG